MVKPDLNDLKMSRPEQTFFPKKTYRWLTTI